MRYGAARDDGIERVSQVMNGRFEAGLAEIRVEVIDTSAIAEPPGSVDHHGLRRHGCVHLRGDFSGAVGRVTARAPRAPHFRNGRRLLSARRGDGESRRQ